MLQHLRHQGAERRAHRPGDDGFSMIAIVLALVVVALASALLLGTTLHSGGSSSTGSGASGAPGVAMADRLQAQQSLNTGLTAAESAAAAGGLSGVSVSQLEQANPSITFVTGPSTGPTTVSVTVSAGDGSSAAGGDQSTGTAGAPNIPGISDGGGASGADGNATGGTGAITLADRSSDSVCWLIWKSSGSATYYGAQTGLTSCSAPQLAAPPTPGPVSGAAIGWQQGSFPSP